MEDCSRRSPLRSADREPERQVVETYRECRLRLERGVRGELESEKTEKIREQENRGWTGDSPRIKAKRH